MKPRLFSLLLSLALPCGLVAPLSGQDIHYRADLKALPASTSLAKARVAPGADTTWQATPNLLFAGPSAGGGIVVRDNATFMGRVDLPNARIVTVEAELLLAAGQGWIALGIGNPQLGSPPWGQGVFLLFQADGAYVLAGDDNPEDWTSKQMVRVKNGHSETLGANSPQKVKLEYDATTQTVSAWLNGATIVDRISLANKGFTVDPAYAGFSGLRQTAGGVIIKSFAINTQGKAPPPASTHVQSPLPSKTPAWWAQGEPVRYSLPSGELPATVVSMEAVVRDASEREIARQSLSRADAQKRGWSWIAPTPGFYEVAFMLVDAAGQKTPLSQPFTARAPNGATRAFEHTWQGFAVLPCYPPVTKKVGQFGFTYMLDLESIPLARLIGMDLANIHPIPWGASFSNLDKAIEPSKGVYHWEMLDPHVDALTAAGIEIAGQFCYTPLWASPHPEKTRVNVCVVEGTTYAPKEMNDYADFVAATVTRYQDRIHLWELWNEPSVPGGSIFWADTPENYLRLMEVGYRTIKRLQPDSEVWFGGIAGRSAYYAFFNKVLSLGAEPFFDTLSLHGKYALDEYRRIETSHKVAPKPAVMSEWHGVLQGNMQSTPILGEEALSFRMMRDLLLQIKGGVSRTILFSLTNLTEKEVLPFAIDNSWFTHSSGLFRVKPTLEPRHAGLVLANFLGVTARRATYVKEFEPAPGVFALQLDTGRGALVTAWSESAAFPARTLTALAAPGAALLDWEGKPVTAQNAELLAPNRLYYVIQPTPALLAKALATDRLISPQRAKRLAQTTVHATYHVGPLFASPSAPAQVPPHAWITRDWASTRLLDASNTPEPTARAAFGAQPDCLDIVVEVQDATHVQNQAQPNWWQGDSLQLAIDCEGAGLVGGQTEILAALTEAGPLLWKFTAADPRGDIPARWTSANKALQYGAAKIVREGALTRYQIRLPWSELYPLTYEAAKSLAVALVINDNNGAGRARYLEWGTGIAVDKDPSTYGTLLPAE